MSWDNVTSTHAGLSICEKNNISLCLTWLKKHGITKYKGPVPYSVMDIPRVLKTGRYVGCWQTKPNTLSHRQFDHMTIYKNPKTKQCWAVCNPHDNSEENFSIIQEWCKANDLFCYMLPVSWYDPEAMGVVITTKEEFEHE